MADNDKKDDGTGGFFEMMPVFHPPGCGHKNPDKGDESKEGPARVNSPAFRAGYDAINWGGKKKDVGQA